MAGVNDVLRWTLSGQIDLVDLFNLVFHYVVITGTETDYDTINAAIGTAVSTAMSGLEAQLSTEVQGSVMDLWEYDFSNHEFDGKATGVTTALIGTNGGAAEPNGIALLMRFGTEELRRQARKFIPGITELNVTNDVLQAAVLAPAITSAGLLGDDITAGGCTLRPCTFNATPLSPRYETLSKFTDTAFVNALVAYQRRRQPGAGA